MDNTELLRQVAVESSGEEREYETKGQPMTFTLARFASVADGNKIATHQRGRLQALAAHKGRLAVTLQAEQWQGLEHLLTDSKELPDGKREVYVTSREEIAIATVLECGLREPKFTWAEAVLFCMVNGSLATQISTDIMVLNGVEAKEEAGNASGSDSEETWSESQSTSETEADPSVQESPQPGESSSASARRSSTGRRKSAAA